MVYQEISRRQHQSALKNLERKEEAADHIHKLHYQLLETATQEMAYVLKARIQDTNERNESIEDVVKVYDDLMIAFYETLPKIIKEDDTDSSKFGAKTNGKSP